MDVDLQDPPSLLPKMYKILLEEEYDSVATRRSDRAGETKWSLRKLFVYSMEGITGFLWRHCHWHLYWDFCSVWFLLS